MTTVPSDTQSPGKPRRMFWWAALVLTLTPLVWFSLPGKVQFYTDAETIKEPRRSAPLRDILWQPPQRVDFGLSLSEDLYEPRLSADGLTLYFVRGKAGDAVEGHADIVVSHRGYAGWSLPALLPGINSDADELGPEISADGRTLYFYSNRQSGVGGYDLWVARRGDEQAEFEAPENLGPRVNSPFNEYGPAVSGDGKTLYFASNRPHGENERALDPQAWSATLREDLFHRTYDLYAAALDAGGTQSAVPLTLLNTDANEGAPAISPSGDFLYFSSDRADGQGGFDLYRARRLRGTLTEIINLGSAINTPANELDPALSLGGFALHFSSDRREGDGATAAPTYRLFQSMSREVFVDAEMRRAAINWAAVWSALAPNLLWALLALLMVLLLLATLRAARDRRLSLIARCLLASLALHALLLMLFSVWQVTAAMAGIGSRKGEIRVALAGSASSAMFTQIRGDLATVADVGESLQPELAVPTITPTAVPVSMASQSSVIEVAPQVVVPPATAAAVPSFRDADPVHLASSRLVISEWKAPPQPMLEFAAPQPVHQQNTTERTSIEPLESALMVSSSEISRPNVLPTGTFREHQTAPTVSAHVGEAEIARATESVRFADATPPMSSSTPAMTHQDNVPTRVVDELAPPGLTAADATSETAETSPNLVGSHTDIRPTGIPVPATAATIMEFAPAVGDSAQAATSVDWRSTVADAAPNVMPMTLVAQDSMIRSAPALPIPEALFVLNQTPKAVMVETVSETRSPAWTIGNTPTSARPEAILPQPRDWTGGAANSAVPQPLTPDVAVSEVLTPVFADAVPVGLAHSALPLAMPDEPSTPQAGAIDLPVAFDLPTEPPVAAAPLPEAPRQADRITGRILSKKSCEPLVDAEIRLDIDAAEPVTVRSDAEGRYALTVPTELPDFFALSAMAEGYMPATANVASHRLSGNGVRVNFRLRPMTSDAIAIEAVPDVHHLGDDRFTGQINSQFQKRSEGRRFRATYAVSAAQLQSGDALVELRFMAKGVQTRHRLLINGQGLPERLGHAPEDGSFGEFITSFNRNLLIAGENTFEIHAGSIGNDVDDFEFVNVQFSLNP